MLEYEPGGHGRQVEVELEKLPAVHTEHELAPLQIHIKDQKQKHTKHTSQFRPWPLPEALIDRSAEV